MGIGEMVEGRERTAARRKEPERSSAASEGGSPLTVSLSKCPYLAGRPPCGTHHLFPSSVNVCWANPGEKKPYGVISTQIQGMHCFGGADGVSLCPQYQQATAAAAPLPYFERPRPGAPSGPEWALPRRRPTRGRGLQGPARLRTSLGWAALCLLLIALSALLLR